LGAGKYAGTPDVFIQIRFDTRKTSVRIARDGHARLACSAVYVRVHQLSAPALSPAGLRVRFVLANEEEMGTVKFA